MALWIQAGNVSINLDAVSLIRWGTTPDGLHSRARVWFVGDPDELELDGEPAADLSNAVSALEAEAETRLNRTLGADDAEPRLLPGPWGAA